MRKVGRTCAHMYLWYHSRSHRHLGELRRLERLTDQVDEQMRRRPHRFTVATDSDFVDSYNAALSELRSSVLRHVPADGASQVLRFDDLWPSL